MKIDDRLSDAMRDYADRIEPETGSWARIASRFDDEPVRSPRRPSRRPLVLAGVALALVAVLITALVVRAGSDNEARVVTQPDGGAAMPERLLAVSGSGQPVVIDATTGSQVNAFDTTGFSADSPVAVTPDGKDAYVVHRGATSGCSTSTLVRLPIGPGASAGASIATGATNPAVSPDGHYLAYLSCPASDPHPHELVLRDLTTNQEQRFSDASGALLRAVSFAPDSRHVLLTYGSMKVQELDVPFTEPLEVHQVAVSSAEVVLVGYLGPGALFGVDYGQSAARVVELSPETGGVVKQLFAATGLPGSITMISPDVTGRNLLVVVDGEHLYRWSEGDTGLTKVTDGVSSAAWIPDTTPTGPPVDPTNAPNGILVAKRSGEMVVLGAKDDQQHSSLGTFPDVSSVSTTADGRQVFFAATGQSGACGNPAPYPDLTRLVPSTGERTRIVGGALSPAVSPNDKLIAYGIWCEGRGLGFTNLLTGENSRSDALGSKGTENSNLIETAEPLGWSPDSTELLYRLGLKGDQKPHYYVGRLWPAVPQSQTQVVALPTGANITGAAFVDNDTVALAETSGSRTEIRSWKLSARPDELPSPVLFEVPGRVTSLVSDPGGRYFLALNQAGDLYRWSRGEDQPTKVAGDVAAATWLPWS